MARFYPHPDHGHMIPEKEYRKIKAEREVDKSSHEHFNVDFHLKGHGFPSKKIRLANKRKKALEKNPNHTTLNDYKFSNPTSIPNKAIERNKKKLRKKGVNIKKRGAVYEPEEEKPTD